MARDATDTREKLIRAAEYLFARSGLDVPIREIHERAGQRNASAIQYHFGSKQELIKAILDRHALNPEEEEQIRIDLRLRRDDPRSVVDSIVRRISLYLATDETRDYVRLAFQLVVRAPLRQDIDAGIDRPDLLSFEAEAELVRSCVPQLPRACRARACGGRAHIRPAPGRRAGEDDRRRPGRTTARRSRSSWTTWST